ncbi:phospholipase D-like domain-containing protein [Rothia terrae]|uniref:Phospholipase D-like domain-containing protein n=1 Tax=Rothia terrae TaxID=396015 RepID=A0A7H2BFR4_9MICC|nr:phospholipase D-like domain-containing protein [Rothia terrae]QNV38510.1 hypothetical protein IDM49_04400 [Rothia terrae]
MEIKFVGQPFDQYSNLLEFIKYVEEEKYSSLKIAVAWAKKSGIGRVWDSLENFKSEGGKLELILGVSEGGATEEGLLLANELTNNQSGFVFHDPNRTFHPKVYWAAADDGRNTIFVGSSNLTAGGVAWNYEASLWVTLAPGEEPELVANVQEWFSILKQNTGSLKKIDQTLIDNLLNSSDIQIGQEGRSRRKPATKTAEEPEDNDSLNSNAISGIFDKIVTNLKSLPKISAKLPKIFTRPGANSQAPLPTPNSQTNVGTTQTSSPSSNTPTNTLPPENQVYRRWSKQMGASDAQNPPSANTNPTGALRLAVVDSNYFTSLYFRQDFWGNEPWGTPDSGGKEELFVNFDVWIDGTYLGKYEIRISHKPSRAANQGNVMTVLHWGHDLVQELRKKNYKDYYVNLEETRSGDYLLIVSDKQRGVLKP